MWFRRREDLSAQEAAEEKKKLKNQTRNAKKKEANKRKKEGKTPEIDDPAEAEVREPGCLPLPLLAFLYSPSGSRFFVFLRGLAESRASVQSKGVRLSLLSILPNSSAYGLALSQIQGLPAVLLSRVQFIR